MQILAVTNLKGGTSKTTLACNLARELKGYLLDADEQGAAESWRAMGNLGVAGQSLPLPADASDSTVNEWGSAITSIDADLIVIDTPPSLGKTSLASMLLADLALVPVGASILDLKACRLTLAHLNKARSQRNGKPACLLVPTRIDRRTVVGKQIVGALQQLGESIAPTVGLRIGFVDSASLGLSICQFDPNSVGCMEIKRLAQKVRRSIKGS